MEECLEEVRESTAMEGYDNWLNDIVAGNAIPTDEEIDEREAKAEEEMDMDEDPGYPFN